MIFIQKIDNKLIELELYTRASLIIKEFTIITKIIIFTELIKS